MTLSGSPKYLTDPKLLAETHVSETTKEDVDKAEVKEVLCKECKLFNRLLENTELRKLWICT